MMFSSLKVFAGRAVPEHFARLSREGGWVVNDFCPSNLTIRNVSMSKAPLAACHGSDSRRHAKKVQGVRSCASPGP